MSWDFFVEGLKMLCVLTSMDSSFKFVNRVLREFALD